MVVGPCFSFIMDSPKQYAPSAALKFGMDRILSNGSGSSQYREKHRLMSPSGHSPAGYFPANIRLCSAPNVHFHAQYFAPGIYVPQPMRPYTNVVMQSEAHSDQSNASTPQHKRKRSWSRAVFSNLQRKGLEKRFQLQKYITKPDRRQLAATLGLTDAQVKVWFQNRRMKWRHAKEGVRDDSTEGSKAGTTSMCADSTQPGHRTNSECDSDIDVQTVDCE